mgnify:CR=1 FL=1
MTGVQTCALPICPTTNLPLQDPARRTSPRKPLMTGYEPSLVISEIAKHRSQASDLEAKLQKLKKVANKAEQREIGRAHV